MHSAFNKTLKTAKGVDGLTHEDVKDVKAIFNYKMSSDGTIEPSTAFKIWALLGLEPQGHELIGLQTIEMDKFLKISGAINKRNFDEELNHLYKIFRMMDHQKKGEVSREALEAFLISCRQKIRPQHLDSLMDKIDREGEQKMRSFTQKQFVMWMKGEKVAIDPLEKAASEEKKLLKEMFDK